MHGILQKFTNLSTKSELLCSVAMARIQRSSIISNSYFLETHRVSSRSVQSWVLQFMERDWIIRILQYLHRNKTECLFWLEVNLMRLTLLKYVTFSCFSSNVMKQFDIYRRGSMAFFFYLFLFPESTWSLGHSFSHQINRLWPSDIYFCAT